MTKVTRLETVETQFTNSSSQITTLDQFPTQVASTSQDTQSENQSEAFVPRKSQPRKATPQDQSLVDLLQFKDKLRKGYTRIPNSILMDLLSGELSPTETKLILLIARMTIGFKNRSHAPLSKKVCETLASSQGGAVLQALQSLERAGKIRKIPGNPLAPNQFGLIFDETIFSPEVNRGSPVEKSTKVETQTSDAKTSTVSETTNNKDNYINKISLSSISIYIYTRISFKS